MEVSQRIKNSIKSKMIEQKVAHISEESIKMALKGTVCEKKLILIALDMFYKGELHGI